MKKIFLYLLVILGVADGVYLVAYNEVYVGEVVGNLNISNPYRFGTSGPYDLIDVSFTYKTPENKMYKYTLEQEDVYFLHNTERGKLLKQGKFYNIPCWSRILGILVIIGSGLMFVFLCVIWSCYVDHDYSFNTKKEDISYHCKCKCTERHLCYFENTKIHISDKTKNEFKNFFGY